MRHGYMYLVYHKSEPETTVGHKNDTYITVTTKQSIEYSKS